MLLIIVMLIVSIGCKNQEKEDSSPNRAYPNKPITVIVSYGPGGATDMGARLLLPYVEQELGVPLHVVNVMGDVGWEGWMKLLNSKPDGYTIAFINTPSLITGYLNPQAKRDKRIEDFSLIANYVMDYGAIAIRPGETRFVNLQEVVEYARHNQLTITSTGVGTNNHIAILKLNKILGTKFVAVHALNTGRLMAGVTSGHIDVYIGNIGEVTVPHKQGQLKVIAVMEPERSAYLPDVPTVEEELNIKVYNWAARGLAGPGGMDREKIYILEKAFMKAMENEELNQKMQERGLALRPLASQEFYKLLKEDEQGVMSVIDLFDWKD